MICRYGAKLIIDDEMSGGDLLIVRIESLAARLIIIKIYQNLSIPCLYFSSCLLFETFVVAFFRMAIFPDMYEFL